MLLLPLIIAAQQHRGAPPSTYTADCSADPGALGKVRDAIRSDRKIPARPITVNVRGICRLPDALELGPQDSHVSWIGGTFSGGMQLKSWQTCHLCPFAFV